MQVQGRHLFAYADAASERRRPVAYLHYRWEQDPPRGERRRGQPVYAVAYVYELQLTEEAQGKGLGSHLMSLVESFVRNPHLPATLAASLCPPADAQRPMRGVCMAGVSPQSAHVTRLHQQHCVWLSVS